MAPTTPMRGSSSNDQSFDTCTDVVASITIAERLPQFWMDSPRLWFSQFEAIVAPQKQGDEYKYNAVIAKLPKEVIHQVSDILTGPPATDKYAIIKERLISCYEESEHRRFHKLLAEMDLGDQKPSQLLRKMREAGCGKMNDDTIRLLWIRQLPPSITTVLAVTEQLTLDKLSEVADRVHENMHFNKSSTRPPFSADVNIIAELTSQLASMRLEIAALQRHRPRSTSRSGFRHRSRYDRSRSNSRYRYPTNKHNGVCYYHRVYKDMAHRCRPPCSWKKEGQSSEN